MTVSKKMANSITKDEEYYVPWNYFLIGGKEEVAQAVVNAAWNKFDSEDESTWPNLYQDCLLKFKAHNIPQSARFYGVHEWTTVTHWAYGQDLMPVMQQLDVRLVDGQTPDNKGK